MQTMINKALKKDFTKYENVELLFEVTRNVIEADLNKGLELNMIVRKHCNKQMKMLKKHEKYEKANKYFELYYKSILLSSPHVFDDYLIYLEKDRPAPERFYLPRRKILKRAVDAMQKLVNNELDELFLNMPPRVGKTTLLMMFLTWVIGRNSEKSNLYSAYSDVITSAMYSGILEIITDEYTYNWKKIFPEASIPDGGTNAKMETINIGRKKRYASLTCRSLYGTLNGACDCNGMLISDDLIGGIEEALNKDRLDSAWTKVDNNLIPRSKESAKILWCGTRWSIYDPVGKRLDILENEEKYKTRRYEVINLPALDENDESNFDYDYGVGYSTEAYHQRRASFERQNDMASWLAQYMNEPIERDGALFTPNEMKFYNGVLPQGEPDRRYAWNDVAWGGGDYLSFPIAYDYGNDTYIVDVVFNKGDKKITQPIVAKKTFMHKLGDSCYEGNNGGIDYKEDVEQILLNEYNYRHSMTSRNAPTNKSKMVRIYEKAPDIREFYFLESGKRNKEYQQFMDNLYSFKLEGKNKNDDAPDSLAGLANMKNGIGKIKVEIISRPF